VILEILHFQFLWSNLNQSQTQIIKKTLKKEDNNFMITCFLILIAKVVSVYIVSPEKKKLIIVKRVGNDQIEVTKDNEKGIDMA
tara:strand:- start:540 stop:791 length:252 start_codon:yes stop_codon:yes gene_type:complete